MYYVIMQNKIYLLLWVGTEKFEIHSSIEKSSYLWLDCFTSLPIIPRETYYRDQYFKVKRGPPALFLYRNSLYVCLRLVRPRSRNLILSLEIPFLIIHQVRISYFSSFETQYKVKGSLGALKKRFKEIYNHKSSYPNKNETLQSKM